MLIKDKKSSNLISTNIFDNLSFYKKVKLSDYPSATMQ